MQLQPWVGQIPWRKAWQPTAIFLPGESHGQRSLAGYSPWGRKESDTTEATEYTHKLRDIYWDALKIQVLDSSEQTGRME